jgi:hypothetical protein
VSMTRKRCGLPSVSTLMRFDADSLVVSPMVTKAGFQLRRIILNVKKSAKADYQ